MAKIPLPFGDRMTACAAVFSCIFIASPQGAQTFAFGNAAIIGPLQLSYAQLLSVYRQLINSDTPNLPADLNVEINTAVTVVGTLNTTIQAMTATGDASSQLAGMKIVVANALTELQNVQADE